MKSITFIIPTYNNLTLLKRCINSIEPQLDYNDKIIIIDDGSSDGTFEYLEKQYALESKFIIIKQENSGSGLARNKGITLNKNEFIWFVDSDDYIVDFSLKILRGILNSKNPDIIFFDYIKKDLKEKTEINLAINPKDKISLLVSTHVPWNKIIKASLFEDVKFPIGRIRYQDHGTLPIVISKANKILYLEKYLYVYDYSHPNNIGKRTNKNDDMYIAFENLYYYYDKGMISKEHLNILYIYTFVFSQIYNTPNNSFNSIYQNTLKVKKYLNKVYPNWKDSDCFTNEFKRNYKGVIENLGLKIYIGNFLKISSFIPTIAIYLYKLIKGKQ